MHKAQSAMEYLMTYGWAILIIAVVLAILYQLGLFSGGSLSSTACTSTTGYLCSSPLMNSTGNLIVLAGQSTGPSIVLSAIGCSNSVSPPISNTPIVLTLSPGQTTGLVFHCPIGSNALGTKFSGTLWRTYASGGQAGQVAMIGSVTAKVSTSSPVAQIGVGGSTSTSTTMTTTIPPPSGLDGSPADSGYANGEPTVVISTTQANDILVLIASEGNLGHVYTVSDSAGLVWHQRMQNPGSLTGSDEWYAIAATPVSGDQITPHYSSYPFQSEALVFAISGGTVSSPYDSHSGLPAQSSGSGMTQSVVYSTSNAGDLIISWDSTDYLSSVFTQPAGFSLVAGCSSGNRYFCAAYDIVNAVQGNTIVGWSTNTNPDYQVNVDAIT